MAVSPVIVILVPVPVVLIFPGFLFSVHVPVEGKPLSVTLPVSTVHEGWMIISATGAEGVIGLALITTLTEAADTQPDTFETM